MVDIPSWSAETDLIFGGEGDFVEGEKEVVAGDPTLASIFSRFRLAKGCAVGLMRLAVIPVCADPYLSLTGG